MVKEINNEIGGTLGLNSINLLDNEERIKIHKEIDAKMQEASDLNLSREEIL